MWLPLLECTPTSLVRAAQSVCICVLSRYRRIMCPSALSCALTCKDALNNDQVLAPPRACNEFAAWVCTACHQIVIKGIA